MAIAYRGSGGVTAQAADGVTLNKPSGVVSGDFMLAIFGYWNASAPVTAPSGWTHLDTTANSAATYNQSSVYYKVAGGSEPATYTWTFGGSSDEVGAGIIAYSGVNTSDPIQTWALDANDTNANFDGLPLTITTQPVQLVLMTGSNASTMAGSYTTSPPDGYTERVEIHNVSYGGAYIADKYHTSTGLTDTAIAVNSAAAADNTYHIALNEASATSDQTATPGRAVSNSSAKSLTAATASDQTAYLKPAGGASAKPLAAIPYPTFINSSTSFSGPSVTSRSPSVPSGTADGDLMLAVVMVELADATITAPGGWTLLFKTALSTRTHTQAVYYRTASSEPASYTWSWSSAECGVAILTYRNAAVPTNYNSQVNNTSTANCQSPSLTVSAIGSLALWIGSSMYGTTWSPPANYTERLDQRTSTASTNMSMSVAERLFTATGTTGTATGTAVDADFNVGSAIVLTPQVPVSIQTATPRKAGSTSAAKPITATPGAATATPGTVASKSAAKILTAGLDTQTATPGAAAGQAQAKALTVTPGAATAPLSPTASQAQAKALIATPGAATAPLSPTASQAQAKPLTATPGAATAPLSPAASQAQAKPLTATPGAVSATPGATGSTSAAQPVTATPGAATAPLSPAAVQTQAKPLTATPGDINAELTPTASQTQAKPVTTTPGDIEAELTPIPSAAAAAAIQVSAVVVLVLTPAGSTSRTEPITATPEDVTLQLAAPGGAAQAQPLTVTPEDITAAPGAAGGDAQARPLTLTPGDINAELTPVPSAAAAAAIQVSAVVGLVLTPAGSTSTPQPVTVTPEDVTLQLAPPSETGQAQPLTVTPGGLTAAPGLAGGDAQARLLTLTPGDIEAELTPIPSAAAAAAIQVSAVVGLVLTPAGSTSRAEPVTAIPEGLTAAPGLTGGDAQARPLTATPGDINAELTPVPSAAAAAAIQVSAIAVLVLTPAGSTSTPQPVTATPEDVALQLAAPGGAAQAQPITLTPGDVTAVPGEARSQSSAGSIVAIEETVVIELTVIVAASRAGIITLTPGDVEIQLPGTNPESSAENLEVIPGIITLDVAPPHSNAAAGSFTASPEAVTIEMPAVPAAAYAQALAANPEAVTVPLTAVAVTSHAQRITAMTAFDQTITLTAIPSTSHMLVLLITSISTKRILHARRHPRTYDVTDRSNTFAVTSKSRTYRPK